MHPTNQTLQFSILASVGVALLPIPQACGLTDLNGDAALQEFGTGHFALVRDERLYVVGATGASQVALPAGRVAIEERSGDSLLVRSDDALVFVEAGTVQLQGRTQTVWRVS